MLNRKQKIHVLSVTCGAILLAMLAVVAPRFLLFENRIAGNDYLAFVLYPIVALCVLLLLPFLAAKLFGGPSELQLVWGRRPFSKIRWLLLLFSATLGLWLAIAIISYHAGFAPINYFRFHDVTKLTVPFFILQAIITVVLTPIAEEVFWRGFVQEQFAKCLNAKLAIVLQAILFALMHDYPVFALFDMFVFGLIMGYWRFTRGSLVPIILAHAMINGLFCLRHLPEQYEMSQKKIAVNYVEIINQAARSCPAESNAAADYEKATACYIRPSSVLYESKILRKTLWIDDLTMDQEILLQNWIQQNSEALEFFRQGCRKPYYFPQYSGTEMLEAENYKECQQLQELACAITWNAKFCAAENDVQTFLNDIVCAFQFGNHLLNGPKSCLSYISGLAIDNMACDTGFGWIHEMELNSEELQTLEQQLQEVFRQYPATLDLTWEKYSLYDSVQRIFTDEGNGNGRIPRAEIKGQDFDMLRLMSPGATDEQIESWKQSDRRNTTALVDELFDFYANIFPQTPYHLHKQEISINQKTAEMTIENIIYPYICNVEMLHRYYHQQKTRQEALVTTLGVLRHQSIFHSFPVNLENLVSEHLVERTSMDAYSDQPLIYKAADGGFLLYSIGTDFEDDGGVYDDDWGKNGGDYVFWPLQKKTIEAD